MIASKEQIGELQVRYLGFPQHLFALIREALKACSYEIYPDSSKVRMNFVRRHIINFRAIYVLQHLLDNHLSPDYGVGISTGAQAALFGTDTSAGRFLTAFKYVCKYLEERGYHRYVWYRQGFGNKDDHSLSIPPSFGLKPLHKMDAKDQKVNRITSDKEVDEVVKRVSSFFRYIKERGEHEIPEDYKEFADNYYKYTIDMDEASNICKERNGYSFEEVLDYFNTQSKKSSVNAKYYVMRNALREYSMCKSFSTGSFCVKLKHGRLYAPFHNLCKDYRSAFRHRKSGEKVVEVTDMKGAFVKGTLCTAMCVSTALKDNETAQKIISILSSMKDPYKFVTDSGCERSVAKEHTLRTLFSSGSDLRNRERILRNIDVLDNEKEVTQYCKNFLNMVEVNPCAKYLNDKDLNKYFKNFLEDRVVFYTLTGKKYVTGKPVVFTNKTGKERGDMYNLTTYIHLCELCLASLGQRMVFDCMEKAYGSDVVGAVKTVIAVFDLYNKTTLDKFSEHVHRRLSRKNGLLPTRKQCPYELMNASILCQNCEGEMMFGNVLPELKKRTNCSSLVTLHDAIYMPESFSKLVDVTDLSRTLDIKFYQTIVKFFTSNTACLEAIKLWKEKGTKNVA